MSLNNNNKNDNEKTSKNEEVIDLDMETEEEDSTKNGKMKNNENEHDFFLNNNHNNHEKTKTTFESNKHMDIDDSYSDENDDDETEDDPVIKRLDVYLSQQLTDNLCVFQYPLRPPWQAYNFEAMKQFKVRPQYKRVNMTFGVNTSDEHYDPDFYMNSNLPKPESDNETFTLNSTHVPSKTNYAVGILRGDQLHLTPVQTVLQMRPDFSHMDQDKTTSSGEQVVGKVNASKEKKSKRASSTGGATSGGGKSNSSASSGSGASSSSGGNLRVVSGKRKTLDDLKREEAKDEWKECKFHTDTSPESNLVREQLFHNSFGEVHFDVSSEEFLQRLVPYQSQIQSSGLSMDLLRQLKPAQQVNAVMMAAKVLKYSRIKELVSKASSDEQLLSLLEDFAFLVQGRWVVKGSVFFRSSPRLAAAQEYLLYLFHQGKPVHRESLTQETSITHEQSYKLFSGVAEIDHSSRTWQIKGEPDHEFLEEFPDVVQRESERWNLERWPNIRRHLEDNMQSLPMRTEEPSRGGSVSSSSSSRGGGRGGAFGRSAARTTSAPPPQTQAKKFLKQMFSYYGVCNMALLRKQFQNFKSAAKPSIDVSQVTEVDFQNSLKSIGYSIDGDKWVMNEFGDKKIDKLRHIVIGLFENKDTVARDEVLKMWRQEASEIKVTPAIYSSVMSELSTKTGKSWRLKTGNAPGS